jgi:uncharacterized protein
LRYIFDWDPDKARINLKRHRGISFERASRVFRDPNMVTIFDEEHSEDEDRWLTLGIDDTGMLLVVVHTFKEQKSGVMNIRIISARRANQVETQAYREAL